MVEEKEKFKAIILLEGGREREGTLTFEIPSVEFPCGPESEATVTFDKEEDLVGKHEYTWDITPDTYKITTENGVVIEGQIHVNYLGMAEEQFAGWSDFVGIVDWGT